MILQRFEGGLLLFRQTDHATLSGDIAAAWGNDVFPEPPRPESTLVAIYRHDDGWAQWELAPKVNAQGEPVDFIRIPVVEHVELYTRGTDLVEAEDAFAGCVVSLHGKRLYTRPLEPGGQPRYKRLSPGDLALAERYVDGEVARERRLVEALAPSDPLPVRAELEEAWRLLQVCDRLSLFVCLLPLGSGGGFDLPFSTLRDGSEVRVAARSPEPGIVELDPYPFTRTDMTFTVGATQVAGDRWTSDAAFRAAFRGAKRRTIEWSARRASC